MRHAKGRVEGPEEQAERIRPPRAAGETIVVTDRGRAVAEIVPPRRANNESFIERGAREGWLTPAKRPFEPLPPRKPIPGFTLEQLLAHLDRDREDRW